MKFIIKIFILIIALLNRADSQNITNTLGNAGSFSIKDGVSTFFTLSQSTGYIDLTKSLKLVTTTDLNTGVIYKGTERFIHDYKSSSNVGENTFVGRNSGNFTMVGAVLSNASRNSGFGYNSLNKITTGYHNSAFGHNTLFNNTTGYFNSAFGTSALYNNTSGYENIAIGAESMYSNTTGLHNVSIGGSSMVNNISGFNNTVVGPSALYSNINGSANVAFGMSSLYDNTSGYNNTGIGYSALSNNTTGNYNTALGFSSGGNVTTGYNLTLIGYDAQPTFGTSQNEITLGNVQITKLRCNVQSITSLSDKRDKKNIRDLTLGLDFISKLKPRQFNWDKRDWYDNKISDGSKMEKKLTAGFIAQELDETQISDNADWLNLVTKENPDKWEATYGNLLPVMVKAIQELKQENDKLKEEIESMKSVQDRVTMLELTILKEASLKEIKSADK